MKALAIPIFGHYPPWEKDGKSKKFAAGEQPDQHKIQYSVPVADEARPKSFSAYVVPCQGEHPEMFLHYTHRQFEQHVVERLPTDADRQNGPLLFSILAKVFQGAAVAIWDQVLAELSITDDASRTTDNLRLVKQRYLEEVAGQKYLKDAAIRFLMNSKKPVEMTPDQFFRRRATIKGYIEDGLLRGNIAIPTAIQLNEAAFLACSKPWQEKFSDTHEEVPAETTILQAAFSQYHASNIRNGTLSKLLKNKEESKKPKEQKKSAHFRPHRSPERRGGYRSGRGAGRDYHRRDDRRHDDRNHHRRDHDRSRRDYDKGRDYKRDGKKPYKRSAREEAHHAEEENKTARRSRSRSSSYSSRRQSRSRSRGRSDSPPRSRECEEQFHAEYYGSNGSARGSFDYDSDSEDDARRRDIHKSHRGKGGHPTFDAPSKGKRGY